MSFHSKSPLRFLRKFRVLQPYMHHLDSVITWEKGALHEKKIMFRCYNCISSFEVCISFLCILFILEGLKEFYLTYGETRWNEMVLISYNELLEGSKVKIIITVKKLS